MPTSRAERTRQARLRPAPADEGQQGHRDISRLAREFAFAPTAARGLDDSMPRHTARESALLIVCPEGERAFGPHRARFDAAARVGVPAHVTITYPFKPVHQLTADDHYRLSHLFGSIRSFVITCESTGWFGKDFLYVQVKDPIPVVAMVDAVTAEFPDFPPYGGVFEELVPHLTVGSDQRADLMLAQREVQRELPFAQEVASVELWTGPALTSRQGTWTMERRYRLR